jgi:hypothetical protein
MLYHLLADTPRSTYDPRKNPGPHVDDTVGTSNVNSVELMTIHMKELSLNQTTGGTDLSLSSNPTQSVDVHSMQSLANPNGNQQLGGNKKKGHNTHKGGINGDKPKDNGNNEKMNDNVGEGK